MLGDIALHSNLGQPLRATVPVRAEADEQLDDSCFSLVRPEQQDDLTYLTQARLVLEEVNGRLQLRIGSQHAISEPFARLSIQADCGQGRLNRVFTILLDPESPVSPLIPALKSIVPLAVKPEALPGKPGKARNIAKPVSHKPASAKPVTEPLKKSPPVPASIAGEGKFRLKLSTEGLDLSALGKLTEEQRQQLREKQRLLDADDQVASTLSMKNRIMQLESEIGELQVALAKTNSHLAMSERLAIAPAKQPARTSPGLLDKLSGGLESISLRGMAGVSLILALLVSVWWRWRRRQAEAWLEAELSQEFSPDATYVMPAPFPGEKSSVATTTAPEKTQEDDFYQGPTSIFDTESESVTFTEAESVLDEADLYLAYGWANRAIELLQEYLEKHLDDVQLWKKLFETYSAQGMKQEFEQLALRCQSTMNDSGLWVLVQKLGRQLDAGNPLYSANSETESEVPADMAPPAPVMPTLDTPLEFVLDVKAPEEEDLHLDPLFPEVTGKTEKGA